MYTKNKSYLIKFASAALAMFYTAIFAVNAEPIIMDDSDMGKSAQSLFEGGSQSEQQQPQTLTAETVVARVDGEEILFAELQQQLQSVLSNVPPNMPADVIQQQIPRILNDSLNGIIIGKLIEKEIAAEKIEVSEDEVAAKLAEIKEQIPEGQTIEAVLEAQNASMEDLKERLANDMAANTLIESKVEFDEDVSDDDVTEFYESNQQQFVQPESVQASHILIGFEEDDDEAAKQAKLEKIKELRAKIVAGDVTFADAAKDNSTCPSSQQGGSLGSFGRGQMVPAFEQVAFEQELGEVSEPVETDFGYHLILVAERSAEKTMQLDEVADNIRNFLIQNDRQSKINEYLKSLREDADVEILLDLSKIQFNQAPAGETEE
jgi:peptidyl-prolyl cis-trans isomerase C